MDKSGKKASGFTISIGKKKGAKKKEKAAAAKSTPAASVNAAAVLTTETNVKSALDTSSTDSASISFHEEVPESNAMSLKNQQLEADLEKSRSEAARWKTEAQELGESAEALRGKLAKLQDEASKWREKASVVEEINGSLDDESFATAQEFTLRKKVEDLEKELERLQDVENELEETKDELQEITVEYETLLVQKQRSDTRIALQSVSGEKTSREELEKLQKEHRQMQRDHQKKISEIQTEMIVVQDSLKRSQEKSSNLRRKLDEVEREKMDLKLEKKRLERRFEKINSSEERKIQKIQAETQDMEIQNLRRAKNRLEKRISMSTFSMEHLDFIEPEKPNSRNSSITSPITLGPTLSEARITNLEKETFQLETKVRKLTKENEKLGQELKSGKAKEQKMVTVIKELKKKLLEEKDNFDVLETEHRKLKGFLSTPDSEFLEEKAEGIAKLQSTLKTQEEEFATEKKELEEECRYLQNQLDMLLTGKLKPEEVEEEEEEEEGGKGDQDLKLQLRTLQEKLVQSQSANEKLRDELEKQKMEADEFLKSLEEQLDAELGTVSACIVK